MFLNNVPLRGNYGSPTSEYRQVWNFCEAVLPIHGSVKFNASNIHESLVRKSLFGGLRLTFVNALSNHNACKIIFVKMKPIS